MRSTHLAGVLAGAVALLLATGLAIATSIPQRTIIASTGPTGDAGNGASDDPVLSASGRVVAFDTTATNLAGEDVNGPMRDVVAVDLATNERRLVSQPPGVAAADGPSVNPTLSRDGQTVAFVSAAANLVAGDANAQPDIFVRKGRDPIRLVSVGLGGAPANGPSADPDISSDGTRVVFTSLASNLVPGDTNAQPDVFLRDLRTGVTTRISVAKGGGQANGRSLAPAISGDGRTVSFTSAATNLVPRDTNGQFDVFVRVPSGDLTERVSVTSKGRQQERAVAPGFVQLSDISENGRVVVFDSDSRRLYPGDLNQHTDVFLRDRRARTTSLVSASSLNIQGNNDSFAPRLSASGRYLIFESFATNLAPGDGPREDIFVRDLRTGVTTAATVTADGTARGPETVRQLLQRASIADTGRVAAFSSTVTNLAPGDANGQQDVFLRLLDAPVGRIVSAPRVNHGGRYVFSADDPLARDFLCQVDAGVRFPCGRGFTTKHPIGRVLTVRAGGAGMLYDEGIRVRMSTDRRGPRIRIGAPRRGSRTLFGRATDASGIAKVQIGFSFVSARGCRTLRPGGRIDRRYTRAACTGGKLFTARGRSRWSFRLPARLNRPFVVYVSAVDNVGNARLARRFVRR